MFTVNPNMSGFAFRMYPVGETTSSVVFSGPESRISNLAPCKLDVVLCLDEAGDKHLVVHEFSIAEHTIPKASPSGAT